MTRAPRSRHRRHQDRRRRCRRGRGGRAPPRALGFWARRGCRRCYGDRRESTGARRAPRLPTWIPSASEFPAAWPTASSPLRSTWGSRGLTSRARLSARGVNDPRSTTMSTLPRSARGRCAAEVRTRSRISTWAPGSRRGSSLTASCGAGRAARQARSVTSALTRLGHSTPTAFRGRSRPTRPAPGFVRQWGVGGAVARDVFEAAERGEPGAVAIRDGLYFGTASAVRALVLMLDVETVVLGGGLSAQGDTLTAGVLGVLAEWEARSDFLRSLELGKRIALLDADIPVAALGAADLGAAGVGCGAWLRSSLSSPRRPLESWSRRTSRRALPPRLTSRWVLPQAPPRCPSTRRCASKPTPVPTSPVWPPSRSTSTWGSLPDIPRATAQSLTAR